MSEVLKASTLSWPVALPAALLVHIGVLSISMGGSPALSELKSTENFRVTIQDVDTDQPEIIRVGAADIFRADAQEFAARLAGPHIAAPLGEPVTRTELQATSNAESVPTERPSQSSARSILKQRAAGDDSDAPLDPGATLVSGTGAQSGSGAAGSSGGQAAAGFGDGSGSGDGITGRVMKSGQGGKDLFSRIAGPMTSERQGAPFALKGQPGFPRACRQGLCRHGEPCEGRSEWRVTVSPSGGTPTKVEAITLMDCELQNASIRKFFNEYKFPSSERTRIYIFPVEMRITR